MHSLRLFFIDSFERGELGAKPVAAKEGEDAAADGQGSPEAVFAAWLHRQYLAYQAALLHLLGAHAPPRTQVAAFAALMECVRGERPGVFNNRLYHRLLSVLLRSEGAAPEVLGLLIAKFLNLADVRYFTLASIAKLAKQAKQAQQTQRAGGKRGACGAADAGSESEGEGEEEAEAEAGQVSAADLARTLHDILSNLEPTPPGMGGAAPLQPDTQQRAYGGSSGEEEEEEEASGGLRSWCGAAEVGIVAAANAGEGSRQRKRQRALLGSGGAEQQQQQRAKWANTKAQQRMYSDAWLAVLRMDLPEDVLKKVLAHMHDVIIPSLANPVLLADFLTAALDQGGLTGMLALHGIFTLVTRHGLEYPRFYARLYQLLTPEAFHAKHRARFFSLADAFLASGMVPAYTAGAFVKRLARLALGAPPAGALLALAFMHNLMRRHPATMQLLHRPPRGGLAGAAAEAAVAPAPAPQPLLPLPPHVTGAASAQQQKQQQPAANGTAHAGSEQRDAAKQPSGPVWQGQDVFDYSEPDPANSRALESSLWELEALRQHANPQVAAYCTVLDKDLRDRKKTSELDVSDLLASSYASLFAVEAGRRLKAVPTAFYRAPPERLFEAGGAGADWAGWVL
ncbi:nucleolar complex 4-like protein [Micractinium conductrix]|uniref:Nucleolar complex 4-like protein n=1 Tax=Micractinium conductrix TaxID=554055 RepID=A0A2P6V732_9CHLO|nr:nucleolar complex 4-like protein [Micractinium conductrix]|eukprot:PSC69895.1 nucleolar complex 4-like protein [Micractinium conductrix]